jgi:hypothetical protein
MSQLIQLRDTRCGHPVQHVVHKARAWVCEHRVRKERHAQAKFLTCWTCTTGTTGTTCKRMRGDGGVSKQ